MKCRYCGSPVSTEDQSCPVCRASDDFAVEDTAEENPAEEKNTENEQFEAAQDTENASNEQQQTEPQQPNNIVPGLSKKEFFNFYIPEKIRSNALWAVYLLFASALANCVSALWDFYFGVICAVVCLVLAIAIKKTLSIGPAIGACVFTILLTIINFVLTQTVTGWLAIVATIWCCVELNKFNHMWTIYTVTSKVPTLSPVDAARAEQRKTRRNKKAGWVVYYVALALCLVGTVAHYVFALTYISKFTFGETDGQRYTNEFYSIDMTFDAGWEVFDKGQLSEMNEEIYWVEDPTEVDTQYILYAMTEKNDMVSIESYFMESLLYSGSDFAEEFEEAYKNDADVFERLDDVEYNGKRYEVIYFTYTYMDTDENGNETEVTAYEKYFIRTEGSYCITIMVYTENEANLDEICAMVMGEKAE